SPSRDTATGNGASQQGRPVFRCVTKVSLFCCTLSGPQGEHGRHREGERKMTASSNHIRVGILGASGYTGAELIRLLAQHPSARATLLTGDRAAGKPLGDVFPHLAYLDLPVLTKVEDADYSLCDLVFCALPHGTTQEVIAALPKHLKVIDLSADFRLHDVD